MREVAPTRARQPTTSADPAAVALLVLARWLAAELHRVDPAHARALAHPHSHAKG